MSKLKYIKKNAPEIAAALAGSLTGYAIHKSINKGGNDDSNPIFMSSVGALTGFRAARSIRKIKEVRDAFRSSKKSGYNPYEDWFNSQKNRSRGGSSGGFSRAKDYTGDLKTFGIDVSKMKTKKEYKKAYMRYAMKNHPDKGGDTNRFQAFNEASQGFMKSDGFSKLAMDMTFLDYLEFKKTANLDPGALSSLVGALTEISDASRITAFDKREEDRSMEYDK